MKHDVILDDGYLNDFRSLFLANLESEQTIYDCYIDTVMLRIVTSSLNGNQLITIGFHDVVVEGSTTSKTQFDPTMDKRFGRAAPVHRIWLQDYRGAWGQLILTKGHETETLDTICDLLRTVHRYLKLKAFI